MCNRNKMIYDTMLTWLFVQGCARSRESGIIVPYHTWLSEAYVWLLTNVLWAWVWQLGQVKESHVSHYL